MAPTPEAPDSGMAGWFASRPSAAPSRVTACSCSMVTPDTTSRRTTSAACRRSCILTTSSRTRSQIGEFMFATAIVGASNALAGEGMGPTKHVGLGRSARRPGNQGHLHESVHSLRHNHLRRHRALPAVAVSSVGHEQRDDDCRLGDSRHGGGDGARRMAIAIRAPGGSKPHHGALMLCTRPSARQPEDIPPDRCAQLPHPEQCKDHRTPAQRASDVAVQNILYRNWLRGTLGSADSPTAQKYGPILYDSKSLTWTGTGRYQGRRQEARSDKDTQREAGRMGKGRQADQEPRIRMRTSTYRAPRAWTASGPGSLQSYPRCSSRCSISLRPYLCCLGS